MPSNTFNSGTSSGKRLWCCRPTSGERVSRKLGDRVDFELWDKPYSIELVSVGAEHDGIIHVVMRVNNKTTVYSVETPRAKKVEIRMATGSNHIGAPIDSNVWRIGNPQRGALRVGIPFARERKLPISRQ